MGSVTPMAYVGSVRVSVTNNTIINPERWVFRILQETVDPNRFLPCGENIFQNNLIVFKSTISRHVNIGGNTAPQTFLLRNNLWYNVDNPSASKMQEAQLTELNGIYGIDPLLRDYAGGDYRLTKDSPAKGKGYSINDIGKDNEGKPFGNPPSIGAYEIEGITSIEEVMGMQSTVIRTAQGIWVKTASNLLPKTVEVFNLRGEHIRTVEITQEQQFIPLEHYQFIMQ